MLLWVTMCGNRRRASWQPGIYGVKFFINGAWQTVVVDDLFPCTFDAATSRWEPIFAGYGRPEASADQLFAPLPDERVENVRVRVQLIGHL